MDSAKLKDFFMDVLRNHIMDAGVSLQYKPVEQELEKIENFFKTKELKEEIFNSDQFIRQFKNIDQVLESQGENFLRMFQKAKTEYAESEGSSYGEDMSENNKKLNIDILRQMILKEMHHTLGTDESYSVHEGDMCEGGCGHDHGDMEVMDSETDMDSEMEVIDDAGIEVDDYEGEMSKSNLYQLAKNATMLHNMLADNTNLEPWVQEKIAIANSMIKSVTDYMEYQTIKKGRG